MMWGRCIRLVTSVSSCVCTTFSAGMPGSSAAANMVSALDMLKSVDEKMAKVSEFVDQHNAMKNWHDAVPLVCLKASYANEPAPPAKGEGVDRADGPSSLAQDWAEFETSV